jgi:hypothetical protein
MTVQCTYFVSFWPSGLWSQNDGLGSAFWFIQIRECIWRFQIRESFSFGSGLGSAFEGPRLGSTFEGSRLGSAFGGSRLGSAFGGSRLDFYTDLKINIKSGAWKCLVNPSLERCDKGVFTVDWKSCNMRRNSNFLA